MTDPSHTSSEAPTPVRASRQRRREIFVNTLAAVLGCLALVVMIATVFRVTTAKLWESTQVNPEYVDQVYEDARGRGWSGSTVENAALITSESSVSPIQAPNKASSPDADKTTESTPAAPAKQEPETTSIAPAKLVKGIDMIEAKRSQIEAVVRGFFEAATVDQKLAFCRDPMRVRPLMESYYQKHPIQARKWRSLGFTVNVDEPGYRFGIAQALFEDAPPDPVVIEEAADGRCRVDWESCLTVGYSELDWTEFLQQRPSEPRLLRVHASKPKIDPAAPTPEGQEVIELQRPGQPGTLLAYFDRNDPKLRPLLEQLHSRQWADVPLTLRLCFPQATSSPVTPAGGARVANVEGKGWLILQATRS